MKHGPNHHILFVFKRTSRGVGGRRRGGTFVLLDYQETIRKKAMTASEGDSQTRCNGYNTFYRADPLHHRSDRNSLLELHVPPPWLKSLLE